MTTDQTPAAHRRFRLSDEGLTSSHEFDPLGEEAALRLSLFIAKNFRLESLPATPPIADQNLMVLFALIRRAELYGHAALELFNMQAVEAAGVLTRSALEHAVAVQWAMGDYERLARTARTTRHAAAVTKVIHSDASPEEYRDDLFLRRDRLPDFVDICFEMEQGETLAGMYAELSELVHPRIADAFEVAQTATHAEVTFTISPDRVMIARALCLSLLLTSGAVTEMLGHTSAETVLRAGGRTVKLSSAMYFDDEASSRERRRAKSRSVSAATEVARRTAQYRLRQAPARDRAWRG